MRKRITALLLVFGFCLGSAGIHAEEPSPGAAFSHEGGVPIEGDYIISADTTPIQSGGMQVSFPSKFPFVIDPYEIAGRGSVYSAPFPVTNHGMESVQVTITSARAYTVQPDVSLLFRGVETKAMTDGKEINLQLCRDGEALLPLAEQPGEPQAFFLEPGETTLLEIQGTASIPKRGGWRDGEIRITMSFHMSPVRREPFQ